MNRSSYMAVAAVVALVFGLALLLIPAQLVSVYDITLGPDGQWIACCLGSTFVGIAVVTWSGRKAPQGDALRAILLGDFTLTIIGLTAALLYAIYGSANALIRSTTAMYAFLAVGFGYFHHRANVFQVNDVLALQPAVRLLGCRWREPHMKPTV